MALSFTYWQGTAQAVFFTNGLKVGEVTDTSAVIWTRLCAQPAPNRIVHPRKETVFRHPIGFDENMPVSKMDGGVAGAPGLVSIQIKGEGKKQKSGWMQTLENQDFTIKVPFFHLQPNTTYRVKLKGKGIGKTAKTATFRSAFQTAPHKDEPVPVSITSSTCQYFWSYDDSLRGFKTYDQMRALQPDFFVQTGDYVYYDKPGPMATDMEKARHKWHAMDAWPSLVDFYQTTPIYMVKDDHDLLSDDAHPASKPFGSFTFEDGLTLWHENVPLLGIAYRTIRWGKDLQIWLVEGREFRTPNDFPDGPDKSIWGSTQKEWLKTTLEASDATFKIIFSATPIVGPDRPTKKDNHSNKVFSYEGNEVRQYLASQSNLFVVNGDRHWQYVSKDTPTGLMEFGSGPVSNYHAQGWKAEDVMPEHRYLNLIGGFLGVRVYRKEPAAWIEFSHYDVLGKVRHIEKFSTEVK